MLSQLTNSECCHNWPTVSAVTTDQQWVLSLLVGRPLPVHRGQSPTDAWWQSHTAESDLPRHCQPLPDVLVPHARHRDRHTVRFHGDAAQQQVSDIVVTVGQPAGSVALRQGAHQQPAAAVPPAAPGHSGQQLPGRPGRWWLGLHHQHLLTWVTAACQLKASMQSMWRSLAVGDVAQDVVA